MTNSNMNSNSKSSGSRGKQQIENRKHVRSLDDERRLSTTKAPQAPPSPSLLSPTTLPLWAVPPWAQIPDIENQGPYKN